MKTKINLLLMFFGLFFGSYCFVSCGDDDDDSPKSSSSSNLVGNFYWVENRDLYEQLTEFDKDSYKYKKIGGTAYHRYYKFLNNNTLDYGCFTFWDGNGTDGYYWGWGDYYTSTTISGINVKVYKDDYGIRTYTQYDNKIIISNGDILTIVGDKLYLDGTSLPYVKKNM